MCSKNICTKNEKNDSFTKNIKIKDFDVKIWSNNFVFNQNDKLIFELALYQYQQKKYPDSLNVNLKQLCFDLEYKQRIRKIRYVFDRLKAFSSLRIQLKKKSSLDTSGQTQTFLFNFSDIECYLENGEEQVKINFKGSDYHMPLSILFSPKNELKSNPKKYIIPFRSQYELLISEFLQLKTTVKSQNDHPFLYRYRNFTLDSILEYTGLLERYKIAEELDKKEQKMIKEIITRTLRKLTQYGLENNISIPSYRYSSKSKMYEIKNFNYPDQRSTKDILLNLEKSIQE